ncbi:MAG: glycosyltransferase family 39 protein [Chloroflexi bacterium]|nr:glycosyltransferase family 39 protein [Chloroflexota bacterium]
MVETHLGVARNHTRTQTAVALTALVIAYLVYFSVGLSNLDLPGLQYDEAADAVPALELIHGLPTTAFSTVTVFGLRLPLMMGHYTGPSSIYTSLVGMTLFGTTTQGLRTSQLLLGAVTIFLLWWLAHTWSGPLTAAIAVLLCASAPAYIWWSRTGAHFAQPLLPLALGFLLLLTRWWRTRSNTILIAAAFVFGLGLTTKLIFSWLVVPIGLTAILILGIPGFWRLLRSIGIKTLFLCACACALGFAPFIVHNIPSGASFQFISENAVRSRTYGHNNLDLLGNIQFESVEFVRMLGGDTLHFDAPAGLPLGALALIASLVYTAALCIRRRSDIPLKAGSLEQRTSSTADIAQPRYVRLRLLLLLCVITVIPLGTISISSIGARHLFIIVPLTWLLIAWSFIDMLAWLAQRMSLRQAAVITSVGVGILVINHTATNVMIQTFLVTTGGRGLWSDAIFTLAHDLESNYANRPVIALDWGFERSVTFLTEGRVHMREMYEYLPEPSPTFADVSTVLLRDPSNIYVFHTPETTAFQGHWDVFARSAAKQHKTLIPTETLYERNGVPNTVIYQAEDTPRSFEVSPTLATRNAVFDGGLTLLGGKAAVDLARREIAVELYWQSTAAQQPDDTVLLHIVDQSNGEIIVVADQQPVYGSYPFSRWQQGEVVTDPHWVALPDNLKPGVYQVRVGVYDRTSGTRRSIDDPLNDAAGNSLMLHWFEIK